MLFFLFQVHLQMLGWDLASLGVSPPAPRRKRGDAQVCEGRGRANACQTFRGNTALAHAPETHMVSSQLASKAPEKEPPLSLGPGTSKSKYSHTCTHSWWAGIRNLSVWQVKGSSSSLLREMRVTRQHNFKIPYSAQPLTTILNLRQLLLQWQP